MVDHPYGGLQPSHQLSLNLPEPQREIRDDGGDIGLKKPQPNKENLPIEKITPQPASVDVHYSKPTVIKIPPSRKIDDVAIQSDDGTVVSGDEMNKMNPYLLYGGLGAAALAAGAGALALRKRLMKTKNT